MRLIGFLVQGRQRDEEVFGVQFRYLREHCSEVCILGHFGERFGEKCLHVRLGPDFVEIGRFPVGDRSVQVRHRKQQKCLRWKEVDRRRGSRAAAAALLDKVNGGPGSAEGKQHDERRQGFFHGDRTDGERREFQQDPMALSIREAWAGCAWAFYLLENNGKGRFMDIDDYKITKHNLYLVSDISLVLGFLSILVSIATWFSAKTDDRAHGERFGIFIGLWVPSFFILSNRLARKAEEL